MSTENNISRSIKRMRLGTKSCSECRRRKVRCIYDENGKQCAACEAHGTQCIPQGSVKASHPVSGTGQRMHKLESIVSRVCEAAGIPYIHGDESSDLDELATKILGRLRTCENDHPGNQRQSLDATPPRTTALPCQLDQGMNVGIQSSNASSAPLMEYMQSSIPIMPTGCDVSLPETALQAQTASDKISHLRIKLTKLLPASAELVAILESTQKFWALWPLHPSQLSPSKDLSVSVISIAKIFIDESVKATDASVMARAIMWLALCIQQAPKDIATRFLPTPSIRNELILSYIDIVDALLGIDRRLGPSLATITCLILQAKCYVNRGHARKAWMSIRTAMDLSLLHGLHGSGTHMGIEERSIWAAVTGYDRQLSLILGLPYSITEAALHAPPSSSPVDTIIMHRMNLLCSHIIDRNEQRNQPSYTTTLELDEELEALRAMFPAHWWELCNVGQASLDVFHSMQTSKLYFFHLKQLVHLPFALQAHIDKKYDYSRISLEVATEGVIACYMERRKHPYGAHVMCFLIDFLAFSAGLILASDLFFQQSLNRQEIREEKWDIIEGLVRELRYASSLLDHPVATQGAQVLQYLCEARKGTYQGPEEYDMSIPYFGRVRIRRPQSKVLQQPQPGPVSDYLNKQSSNGLVALETNVFTFGSFASSANFDMDVDWSSFIDDQICYDWSGNFEF